MKIFSQIEARLEKLNRVLDLEIAKLDVIRLEHHKSWDSHILTLSIASIGFCLTFAKAIPNQNTAPLGVGIILFVLSIIAVLLSYLHADKGQQISVEDHIERRSLVNKAIREYEGLILFLEKNKDVDQGALANDYQSRAKEIFSERDSKSYETKLERINKIIKFYNFAKTLCFISGLLVVSICIFFSL